jgi:hypothetical protein
VDGLVGEDPPAWMTPKIEPITPEQLTVVPANEASWYDLEALAGLGGHGRTRTHSGHLPGPSAQEEGPGLERQRARPRGPFTTAPRRETDPAACSRALSESLDRELADERHQEAAMHASRTRCSLQAACVMRDGYLRKQADE